MWILNYLPRTIWGAMVTHVEITGVCAVALAVAVFTVERAARTRQ